MMKNCDVTENSVNRMYGIWVVYLSAIKQKMTRNTPDRFIPSIVSLPAEILEKNRYVTLDTDNFHTNKLSFLFSLNQAIIFNTMSYLIERKKYSLLEAITLICQLYCRRDFLVKYINTYNEFTHKQDLLEIGTYLNVCAANEHEA